YSALNNHTPWYGTLVKSDLNYTDLLSDDISKTIIPYSESSVLKIFDFDGNEKGSISLDQPVSNSKGADSITNPFYNYFTIVQWSYDGKSIVTLSSAGDISVFASDRGSKRSMNDTMDYISLDVSKTADELIALTSLSHQVHVLNIDGTIKKRIEVDPEVIEIKYTSDGKNILMMNGYLSENSNPASEDFHPGQVNLSKIGILNIQTEKKTFMDSKSGEIERVTPSPKGNFIATEHNNNSISVWDNKGKLVQNIKLPYTSKDPLLREIVWIEFHPFDKYLAVSYRDYKGYLYRTDRITPPVVLSHDQLVTFINFSSNGERILTGSADNTAAVWDLSGKRLYTLLGHQNDVTGGKLLDDERVLTTSLDRTLRSWQLENYSEIVLKGHEGKVNYLDIDPGEKYLVSAGSDDHTMRLWDLNSRREVHKISLGEQGVRYVQFINETEVLGITNINEAFLYTLFNDKLVLLKGHIAPIEWAESLFNHIITASKDGSIGFWNKNGKPEKMINLQAGPLISLRINEADSLVAVGSDSGRIFLYNHLGEFKGRLSGHHGSVNYLDISKDGMHMVSASNDRTGIIWNLKTKKPEGNLDRIACAPYNVDCNVISANFSYNGQQVVTTSSDRTVRVWALNGDLKSQMVGHVDALTDAYFSPNDRMVYSFSADRTLRLWDVSGKEIVTYRGHTGKINMAAMDRAMNRIYTASDDGTIRIWLSPIGVYQWIKQNKQFQSIAHSEIH
ncbi:MAG: WD40 repeat domain-containing protein, partial [Saprospiraceae bacterium]